tara:strand:+ start:7717 stop:8352 length:636 start_codon:yes stop_codon:yes gene_type:complete
MGAWDLTYDCNASSFEDVVVYFDKLIEEQEKRGYDRDDPYCANVTSFHGIKNLDGFAKSWEEAQKEVLDKSEKWGPAVSKFYYPKQLAKSLENGTTSLNDVKKKVNANMKIYKKLKKEEEKLVNKVDEFLKKIDQKKEGFTSCISCKSKISNNYVKKCVGTGWDKRSYYNTCCICSKPFIRLNEEKLNICKKNYNEISHVYQVVFGGWVAS